ncbi:MAG TPA: transglycosylase SLT domain-containing protein [Anaerolineaceae bacterium]|nr:transglycosylase SLT domain-containing protein [Anaerolineaceae bacterium]HPN50808.1 transglycosylase SLT domain-containing protein [Anaerolineaceae bacterium]
MKKVIVLSIVILLLLGGCVLPSIPFLSDFSPTPTLSSTPTPSLTPTQTPTPTATFTATPAPTQPPSIQLNDADAALFDGDYEKALALYQGAFSGTNDPSIQASALFGQGKIAYLQSNLPDSLRTMRSVTELYSNTPAQAYAFYYLGLIYTDLQRYNEAIEAFTGYTSRRPGILDAEVFEKQGDLYALVDNHAAAIEMYQKSLSAMPEGFYEALQIKIARTYLESADYETAISLFQVILEQTNSDYTRAQMEFLIGQAYLTLGKTDDAYQHFETAVNQYPRSYDAYSALVTLVNAGVPVDELNRGLIDYYAGQYNLAIQAFDRYLAQNADHDATAHYYKALALRELGLVKYPFGSDPRNLPDMTGVPEDQQAISEFDLIIKDHAEDSRWIMAWDEKAYTQWYYHGSYAQAAQTLLDCVSKAPQSNLAPQFIYDAGRNYERANMLSEAASTWERLADEYPSAEMTIQGVFFAGISRYRLGEFPEARRLFQRALMLSTAPKDVAAANLWIGKTYQQEGNAIDASASWQAAISADPTGYYSERARDLVLDRPAFSATAILDFGFDLNQERIQAEFWLKSTFAIPPETNLSSPGTLANNPYLIRAWEFWHLGLYQESRTEIEYLREQVKDDPAACFVLLPTLLDLRFYRSAIFTSRRILTLAGLDDAAALDAPAYFNHIRFGPYYKEIVLETASAEAFDPLFIFSIIRQESMFEGFVQSSAGARGLMQLMPATAENVAYNWGWPDEYSANDLYRPYINIPLGVHYLSQQRKSLPHPYSILAAYNGGPGNASAWLKLAGDDPDLFLEVIRYQETRNYVTYIFENYNIYRRLYGRNP